MVSNHGGRQLDGAPSSIEVLPEIVDAVGSQMEIMFDGGIRSGQDVMRALALGAKSCMIGRAYAYGLGAGGQAGVAKAIDIIAKELDDDHGPVRRQHHRRDRRPRAGGLMPNVNDRLCADRDRAGRGAKRTPLMREGWRSCVALRNRRSGRSSNRPAVRRATANP